MQLELLMDVGGTGSTLEAGRDFSLGILQIFLPARDDKGGYRQHAKNQNRQQPICPAYLPFVVFCLGLAHLGAPMDGFVSV